MSFILTLTTKSQVKKGILSHIYVLSSLNCNRNEIGLQKDEICKYTIIRKAGGWIHISLKEKILLYSTTYVNKLVQHEIW